MKRHITGNAVLIENNDAICNTSMLGVDCTRRMIARGEGDDEASCGSIWRIPCEKLLVSVYA